ncbi:MAG: thiamine biosynthesis protein ThiF, partial [Actinomycetota bacterium]|nr:thiamine biosynthesis protein ThiF [Actinomycetota bacterium]
ALAAAEVLAHVDGRRTATAGATASLSLLDPWPTLRPWPMHPACGCAWHTFSAARGQWGA